MLDRGDSVVVVAPVPVLFNNSLEKEARVVIVHFTRESE